MLSLAPDETQFRLYIFGSCCASKASYGGPVYKPPETSKKQQHTSINQEETHMSSSCPHHTESHNISLTLKSANSQGGLHQQRLRFNLHQIKDYIIIMLL